MWTRLVTGISALGIYGWTLDDPKRAFNTFYDVSNWLTSHVLSGDSTFVRLTRNFFNDLLIDQFKGFLLGIAVATLLSIILWPFKAGTRWASGQVARMVRGGKDSPDDAHKAPADHAGFRSEDADPHIDDEPEIEPTASRRLRR